MSRKRLYFFFHPDEKIPWIFFNGTFEEFVKHVRGRLVQFHSLEGNEAGHCPRVGTNRGFL